MIPRYFSSLFVFVILFFFANAAINNLKEDPRLSGWRPFLICKSCAPVEKLRASAFGIELTPDYVTLAMKFSNRTTAHLVKVAPTREYWNVLIGWMTTSAKEISTNENSGLEILIQRQLEHDIILDALRQLRYELTKYYPEVMLEYGGAAVSDYIFRNPATHSVMQTAIQASPFFTPQNEEHFFIYPSDQAISVTTWRQDIDSSLTGIYSALVIHDALVITNTSSYLSASWYQYSLTQTPIGTTSHPKSILPYLQFQPPKFTKSTLSKDQSTFEASMDRLYKPNLTPIQTLITTIESAYKSKSNISSLFKKGPITGKTQLILRVQESPDSDLQYLFRELGAVLKTTRFDPTDPQLSIFRLKGPNWIFQPALFVALMVKEEIDSSLPAWCFDEHPVCEELKQCVKQEARGELVICEDVVQPEDGFDVKLETAVMGGLWQALETGFVPWVKFLSEEVEARMWLWYCVEGMPWSSEKSEERCRRVIVSREGEEKGVDENYVGTIGNVVSVMTRYWVTGDTGHAMASIPLYWFGGENLLRVFFWAVNRIMGQKLYDEVADFVEGIWETEWEPIFKEIMQAWNGVY
ncbi:hypothetical protein B0J11DRAFT_618642 [Dendryphion nanum]|uniref:Uncharacterized protein n=1 Tax=Dendryphion nanum TaxID=256645 RepID=A0A9P9D9T4_9PLEO|nr:hypothetical protein B0J11DRAFT_618642 [Dendryphion nanum]